MLKKEPRVRVNAKFKKKAKQKVVLPQDLNLPSMDPNRSTSCVKPFKIEKRRCTQLRFVFLRLIFLPTH